MKYITLLIFVLGLAFGMNAQEVSNKQRLSELPELIEKAAAQENFSEAAKLQRELEIREELELAIKDKDYKTAAQKREELNNLNKETTTQAASSSRPASPRPGGRNGNENTKFYLDITAAGMDIYGYDRVTYVDIYDQNGWYVGTDMNLVRERELMYGFNLKLGSMFYFGQSDRKFRLGLDVNYLSLNLGFGGMQNSILPFINFSVARPGILGTLTFKENMGMDFKVNGGLMLLISQNNPTPLPIAGYSVNPQVKFWINKIAVGLEYNFGRLPSENVGYNHLGLSFGFRL